MLSVRAAQTIERSGERARLASWRGDNHVAHLSPTVGAPLSVEFVSCCLDRLRDQGYRSVVTSALSADECAGFIDAGFDIHEKLDLLAHDLRSVPPRPAGVRRARSRDRRAVLEVDAVSFPPFWRLHEGGLAEALAATPHVRFRVVGGPTMKVGGYVIAGRGAGAG
ncbi:MAG TPA: hypothetical protein VI854_09325, partial [Acidimicrobiia bacterium]|nr:hypothetical protein [Acidimicrobiia bacterium]